MSQATAVDPGFALRFFDAGNALPGIRALKPMMLDRLRLRRGMRVLEVGCGTGRDAYEIARRVGPAGRVFGVDASAEIVAEARRQSVARKLPVEFAVGDARALELPDGSVDRCRAERLLMHVPGGAEAAVAELARVLRPGGRAVVFDFDWDTFVIDGAEPALTRRIVRSFSDGLPNGRAGRALPRLLRDAGLIDVTVQPHAVEIPYDFFGWVISAHLDSAIAEGLFSPKELIGWWDELDRADAGDRFLAALLGFVVTGTKPGADGAGSGSGAPALA